MLSLLLICQVYCTFSRYEEEATFNAATNLPLNGISVSTNPHSVAISDTNYLINVQTQDAYDMKISLNKQWSFDPSYNSTLILTIQGETPFPTADGDILIVFSVGNFQYFSFFCHVDSNNIKSRIYPSLSLDNNHRNVSQWIADTTAIHERWHRISNNDQWIALNQWRDQVIWPLKFVISNNPSQGFATFALYHNNPAMFAIDYTFESAFLAHKNMDIYIMGDSKNEQYTMSEFGLFLRSYAPTNAPTVSPTNAPTNPPRSVPTANPLELTPNMHSTFAETNEKILSQNNDISNDNHILIFLILISVALCAVITQICCMVRKCIKRKYFTNVTAETIPNAKQMEFETQNSDEMPMEQEMVSVNCNNENEMTVSENSGMVPVKLEEQYRKATGTVSTTDKYECNIGGRRTLRNDFELKRPDSETVTHTNNFGYGGVCYNIDEGNEEMSNADTHTSVGVTTFAKCKAYDTDNYDTTDVEHSESKVGLMDAHTINQYWQKVANFGLVGNNSFNN